MQNINEVLKNEQFNCGLDEIIKKRKKREITLLQSKKSELDRCFKPCAIGKGTRIKVAAAIGLTSQKTELFSEQDIRTLLMANPDFLVELSVGEKAIDNLRHLHDNIHIPIGCSPSYSIFSPNKSTTKIERYQIIEIICSGRVKRAPLESERKGQM